MGTVCRLPIKEIKRNIEGEENPKDLNSAIKLGGNDFLSKFKISSLILNKESIVPPTRENIGDVHRYVNYKLIYLHNDSFLLDKAFKLISTGNLFYLCSF